MENVPDRIYLQIQGEDGTVIDRLKSVPNVDFNCFDKLF